MVKITDIILNNWKHNKKLILIISLVVIFISIGVYSYFKFAVPMAAKKDTVNISNANRREKFADIMFFQASWCPFCTKASPKYKAFCRSYDKTIINGYTINCIEVDCSTQDDPKVMEQIQKMKVEKFPTIIMIKDKTTISFDAKITEENLTKFVNTVL